MTGSGGIGSYGTHDHEHNITKCLHRDPGAKMKSGGSMAGGPGFLPGTAAKPEGGLSAKGLLFGEWRNFLSKSAGVFGGIRGSGDGYGNSGKNGLWAGAGQDGGTAADTLAQIKAQAAARLAEERGTAALHAKEAERTAAHAKEAECAAAHVKEAEWAAAHAKETERTAAQTENGAVIASAAVSLQRNGTGEPGGIAGTDNKTVQGIEKTVRNKWNGREGMADGKFRRREEGRKFREFFRRFGKNAFLGKLFWKEWQSSPEQEEKETAEAAEGKQEDFSAEGSSYLLDSYNRSGEYSTLAKDRSLEGSFRVSG